MNRKKSGIRALQKSKHPEFMTTFKKHSGNWPFFAFNLTFAEDRRHNSKVRALFFYKIKIDFVRFEI